MFSLKKVSSYRGILFAYLFLTFGRAKAFLGNESVVLIDFCLTDAIYNDCSYYGVNRQDICVSNPALSLRPLTSLPTFFLIEDERDPRFCQGARWIGPSINSTFVCVCDSKIVCRGEVTGDSTRVYANELTKGHCSKIENTAGEAGDGQVQRTKPDQSNSPTPNTTVNGTNPTHDDDSYYFDTWRGVIIILLMCLPALGSFTVVYCACKLAKDSKSPYDKMMNKNSLSCWPLECFGTATTKPTEVTDPNTNRDIADRFDHDQSQYVRSPKINLPQTKEEPV